MTLCLPCSEGDAVRQPDESAGLGHRPHGRAALRAAGGAAGPGKLGGEEVRPGFVPGDAPGMYRDRTGNVPGMHRECTGIAPGMHRDRGLCVLTAQNTHAPTSQLCEPLVSCCLRLGAVGYSVSKGLL